MILRCLFVIFVCFIFPGCWFSSQPIPLPENTSQYAAPVQKHIKFSEPRKIKWHDVPADSIRRGKISPFDFSKLPSWPYNPSGFKAFLKPPTQKSFDYNSLPDTAYDLDKIPDEPIIYKVSELGRIKKITLGTPKPKAGSYFTSFEYNEEQGIPGSAVQTVLHTRDGLIWFATANSICILNGESLEILPNNYGLVSTMAEDGQGRVWLRSRENGVYQIDRKAGIQKQFILKYGSHIRIDQKGFIWIPTFNFGLYIINPDQKTFKHLGIQNGLLSNHTFRSLEDAEGRVWISGFDDMGINIMDPVAKKFKRLSPAQGLMKGPVLSLGESRDGNIYIGGIQQGLQIINLKNKTFKNIDSVQGFNSGIIYNILEDHEDRLWLGTDLQGVYVLDKTMDSITQISIPEGLGDSATLCLDTDKQNRIFVGTTGGLNVFLPGNQAGHLITKKDGLLNDQVWGIMEDDKKRIWFGTNSGVNILTPDQKFLDLKPDAAGKNNLIYPMVQTGPGKFILAGAGNGVYLIDEGMHTIEKLGLREGLPTININTLFQDASGKIWIGTGNNGVILFDPQKRTIRFLNQGDGLSSITISAINEDSSGKIWLAGNDGVDWLDLKENTVRSLSQKNGLSVDKVSSVFKDYKERFWVISENGLNLIDPAKKTNTIFSVPNGMSGKGVYSLTANKNHIYAGTELGLTELVEKDSPESIENSWNLHTYGKPQGFAYLNFNEYAALLTGRGQFWWGIIEYVTTMNLSAITSDSIFQPAQVTDLDILGKSQYFIDPSLIKNVDTVWNENTDSFKLKNVFSALSDDKKRGLRWDSLSSAYLPVNLSLPYNRNYLRFHFGNTLPQENGSFTYQYILDGVDEKWSPITDLPVSENYNNISPGNYTFRIATRKGLGSWSEPCVFHFRIRPPLWFTWWAELLYGAIFIGALRKWVQYRSRRLLKENTLLEQKITERTTELRNSLENLRQTQGQLIQAEKMASLGELTAGIAHEIQNPLNFVNNFSEVNSELIEDVNKALEQGDIPEAREILKDVEMNMGKITFHGKRADAIVKGMLLHSRSSSGQKIPTNLNELADEYLRLSYHGLRARDKSFNAQFSLDLDENMKDILLVQQDIGRVFLNIFNNSFYSVTEKKKISSPGYEPSVTVQTRMKKDLVEIRIRDNGLGIPKKVLDKIYQPFFTTKPPGQGTGLGLSLSYDIITKEHGGKIDVLTKENEFTEFIIELPFQA